MLIPETEEDDWREDYSAPCDICDAEIDEPCDCYKNKQEPSI